MYFSNINDKSVFSNAVIVLLKNVSKTVKPYHIYNIIIKIFTIITSNITFYKLKVIIEES